MDPRGSSGSFLLKMGMVQLREGRLLVPKSNTRQMKEQNSDSRMLKF